MSSQNSTSPQKIYLKDYKPSDFNIENVQLSFSIEDSFTLVTQYSSFRRVNDQANFLLLDGSDLELIELLIDGKPAAFEFIGEQLKIAISKDSFMLTITTKIRPNENTALEGLYKISQGYVTQCEAQGFRRITYFLDRPDVMARYKVSIRADAQKFPTLLSNGNLVSSTIENGVKTVVWEDPHKKPCYLFALVAGDFEIIEDEFVTASKRKVKLQIYVPHGQGNRAWHAMESLKKSMAWDETRYGREYDLDLYMIVSTDDFNAGAMENKGLNIFNSKLVLADSKTATDQDYFRIESVVAHEYFHNWTGNRVTLRDWFHLSLKEGLTVFRDQEFSMDQSSKGAIRIDSVDDLRSSQFSEDSGPNAHPIRPTSCYAVDNFFTSTIYEKGSEVIRMMQTMVGRPGFRKGMDLYFSRFDGQAVTIEDFAKAISDANQQDWDQFKLWYSQAGTPVVDVETDYDEMNQTYEVRLQQSCALTSQEQIEGIKKHPFHIPLVIGLIDMNGNELSLNSDEITVNSEGQHLIHLQKSEQTFKFTNISSKPVLSINRFFSAPIHLRHNQLDSEKIHLLKYDSDPFNRWESSQNLMNDFIMKQYNSHTELELGADLVEAYKEIMLDRQLANDVKASLLQFSTSRYLVQLMPNFNSKRLSRATEILRFKLARNLENEFHQIYHEYHGKNIESKDPKHFADRKLKNLALYYLATIEKHEDLVIKQYNTSLIMTDLEAAFNIILNTPSIDREYFINDFYQNWKSEYLVINKWFALIASSNHPSTFKDVLSLSNHNDFNIKNPNRVYSLLLRFGDNIEIFHNEDHQAYEFFTDKLIEIDRLNPNVASRIAGAFDLVTKLEPNQALNMKRNIRRALDAGLSANTYEILVKQIEAVN